MSDYAVVNPATDQVVATYPTITTDALHAAIDQAERAGRAWVAVPVAQRAAVVRRIAALHTERREQLAAIVTREMGKPRAQALIEIDFCASIYAYYADHAPALLADQPIPLSGGAGSAFVRKQPFGVLLGIMPWNFPFYQVARFAAPNLMIGNTLLLKHAPQCPESATAIEALFLDAGLPAGAYVNIFATNDQIEGVIADPRVRGISVTGSKRAGQAVAQLAGKYLKKVVLEMGGSDPFILLGTDDMDATVAAAVAARLDNTGQSCNAAKRFIVIDTLYDEFVRKFTAQITAVKPSDPARDEATLGPLSSRIASDRLEEQVHGAVAGGAHLAGGARRGNFFDPGVLTGVTPDNPAYRQEFFGPIAGVYKVASEAEAIRVANDTEYGLGSYVFANDRDQALRVANALETGMVYINVVGADAAELPFGGVKASGFGRELGTLGMAEFVNNKLIRIG